MVEKKIHKWMISHRKSLLIAESCTGGAIAARLTALPGASKYFLGSLVTYSPHIKKKLLKVSSSKDFVNEETVKEMAEALFQLAPADYVIAVTGIAGPDGGSKKKPIGTVWAAIGKRGEEIHTWKMQLHGNRKKIISSATSKILSTFLNAINYNNQKL